MLKEKNYAKVLLDKALRIAHGSLFISISKEDKNFLKTLLEEASKKGIKDVSVHFYDAEANINEWGKYISKDASFLFIVDDKWNGTLSYRIFNGFRAEEIEANFTAALSPNKLFVHQEYNKIFESKDAIIEFNKYISEKKHLIMKLSNFNFNYLSIQSLKNTDLFMGYQNEYESILKNNHIRVFPNEAIELLAIPENANGYIEATRESIVDDVKVEGLRLEIRNGMVIDFDCGTHYQKTKDMLCMKNEPRLYSVGLVGASTSLYDYDGKDNYILNINSSPFITIKTKEDERIYVPIASRNLVITGSNEEIKKKKIYVDEDFEPKIFQRK